MGLDEELHNRFMDAGAFAVRFNSPMGAERAVEVADFVASSGTHVLDLGCGTAALAVDIAACHPEISVVGLDTDMQAIERGRSAAQERAVSERVDLRVSDASECDLAADIALCIGSTHLFGEPADAIGRLRAFGRSAAVIGDLVWTATPEQEHLDIFGPLPVGEQALVELAVAAGWEVVDSDRSSLAEWDEFEVGWIEGVRKIGTPDALAFAAERQETYESYRGVAGFGWLFLR